MSENNATTGSKGRKSAMDIKEKSAENFDAASGSGGRKTAIDILDMTDSGIDYNSDYEDYKGKDKKKSKRNTLLYVGGAVVLGILGIVAFKKK